MTRTIDPNDAFSQEVFQYLDELQESGKINMMEAPSVLVRAYGFQRDDARQFFILWTERFNEES